MYTCGYFIRIKTNKKKEKSKNKNLMHSYRNRLNKIKIILWLMSPIVISNILSSTNILFDEVHYALHKYKLLLEYL